ncbi:MAG: hypothetical protein BRD48_06155 [Bacteroidetes bacterium QS_9_68_14]|nr:MAG: hypothetical protein BRD48_06155 [Bacteroidetes bacterium QS_9_68_14]
MAERNFLRRVYCRARDALLLAPVVAASALIALLVGDGPAFAQQGAPSRAVQAARQAFRGPDGEGKDGPLVKIGRDLAQLYYKDRLGGAAAQGAGFDPAQTLLPVRSRRVRIDAVAAKAPSRLRTRLEALGLARGATAGPVVSGWLPVEALAEAAQLAALRFARPSLAKVVGAKKVGGPAKAAMQQQEAPVVSQGVEALGAAEARERFDTDGSGVTVGVLSDSFDCQGGASDDEEAGEIPPPEDVLLTEEEGCGSGTDEGRAMVQIIFDVAPEADQRFSTAFGGIATFENSIRELAGEGASVIVDDVIYFAEPMFAEGVIAQGVNDVFDQGVAYFSAAGNSDGNSYESESGFRDSEREGPLEGGPLHDFDPGGATDSLKRVSLQEGLTGTVSLQWPQPYPSAGSSEGASSDLDMVLLDKNGDVVAEATFPSVMDDGTGNDPVEVLQYENDGSVDADDDGVADTTFQVGIELVEGPPPEELLKAVYSSFELLEYDDRHSTLYGHANARGAEAVAAAAFFNTPAFNEERENAEIRPVEAPFTEGFSALGGTPIYFADTDDDGTPEQLPDPRVRAKPEVIGPDGGDNTFFGQQLPPSPFEQLGDDPDLPNFFGTSAAAPHVAGVAALMYDLNADLPPSRTYRFLEETAVEALPSPPVPGTGTSPDDPICPERFTFKTGCGFVDAVAALDEVPTTLAVVDTSVSMANGTQQVEITVTTREPGAAEKFAVKQCFGTRDECGTGGPNFKEVKTVEATGESTLTFTTEVNNPGTYTFLVQQVNSEGGQTFQQAIEVPVPIPEGETFALTGAFPNPFQHRTQVRLVVGDQTGQSRSVGVTATLYDARARRVKTFFEGTVDGQRTLSLEAGSLASGVYFMRVESEDFLKTRSVVLVR